MVTPIEWGLFALITLLTGLLSAYIVYRVIKPGLKKAIAGYVPYVGKVVRSEIGKTLEQATEGLDMDAISGALGSGGSEGNPLAAISGLLGGGGGGLEQILSLLGGLGGQQTQTTKKGEHRPGR